MPFAASVAAQVRVAGMPSSCQEAGRGFPKIPEVLQTISNHPSADGYNTLGALYAQREEWDCAIAALGEALRLNSNLWDARYNLGLTLISHRDFGKAVRELQVAVQDRPDSFAAHNALGVAFRSIGQLDAAADEFGTALRLNPRSVGALLNLAEIDIEQQRYAAAIYYLQQALGREPSPEFTERLEMDLAVAYSKNEDYKQAAELFKKLVRIHPNSAELHFDLATSYAHLGEYHFGEAAREYREVLRLDPKNDIARLSLVKALLSLKGLDSISESLPYVRDYIQNHPEDPEGYDLEGQAYRKLGQYSEAVTALRRAVAMNPKSYDARYNLAFSLSRLGNTDEAIEQLREGQKLKPEAPEPAYELGLLLSKRGEAKASQTEFQKFQKLKEKSELTLNAGTVNEKANQLLGEGKVQEAVEAYTEALKLAPGNAQMHYNLSLAYSRLGRRTDEKRELQKAVDLDRNFAKAHSQLGLRYMEDGDASEAESELKAALNANPHFAEAENNLGVLYGREGKSREAEDLFRQATEDNPQYSQAFVNLGLVYAGAGKFLEAKQEFKKALRLSPGDPSASTALRLAEAELGEAMEPSPSSKKDPPEFRGRQPQGQWVQP